MSTYTISGFVIQEDGSGTFLGVRSTSIAFVVPDAVTTFTTAADGTTSDGEVLLNPVIDAHDIRLDGTSAFGRAEADLVLLRASWSVDGVSGTSILANIYDNDTDQSFVFVFAGDPLPAVLSSDLNKLRNFVDSSSFSPADASTGFAPGQTITLSNLSGVVRTEDDTVSDDSDTDPGAPIDDMADLGIGDDTWNAGPVGNDTLEGGAGSDSLFYFNVPGPLRVNLSDTAQNGIAAGTVVKPNGTDQVSGFENVHTNDFDDEIWMSDTSGFVISRGGNDTVNGGDGGVSFRVGSGTDIYVGGAGFDVLEFFDDGFDGAGAITQGVTVTMSGQGTGSAIDGWGATDTFSGIEAMIGTALDDTFVGGTGNDEFDAGLGNDSVFGGAGDDIFILGSGNDTFDGGDDYDQLIIDTRGTERGAFVAEVDLVTGDVGAVGVTALRDTVSNIEYIRFRGEVDVRMTGSGAAERLRGDQGNDRLDGAGGNDRLDGGDGADTLIGGAGDDRIFGGTTDADLRDVVFGGDGNDTIEGGAGNDELRGDAGNDDIAGGAGADTVIGGAGDDVMTGSNFGDVIFGGDGFDFINGGFGSDRLNGGNDADRFFHVGVAGHGSDWIQDYDASEGDVLLYGGSATVDQFQVNRANTANAGEASVDEAFVIYKPSGQILWALVDGFGNDAINIRIGGVEYDLLG